MFRDSDGRESRRAFRSVYAFASLKLRRTRLRLTISAWLRRVASEGEAWWAKKDSNLQPDRCERRIIDFAAFSFELDRVREFWRGRVWCETGAFARHARQTDRMRDFFVSRTSPTSGVSVSLRETPGHQRPAPLKRMGAK